jgi:hypothetical protein
MSAPASPPPKPFASYRTLVAASYLLVAGLAAVSMYVSLTEIDKDIADVHAKVGDGSFSRLGLMAMEVLIRERDRQGRMRENTLLRERLNAFRTACELLQSATFATCFFLGMANLGGASFGSKKGHLSMKKSQQRNS